ncbi:hypothetical protein [Embleya sp. AB8]|uniref:hypothetical protein n=1 Tax=Embleya sp. AB8 TaxID=3156304 RepID=UPI003C725248
MSVLSTRTVVAVAMAGTLGLGLAACGGSSKSSNNTPSPPATGQPAQPAPGTPGTPGPSANGTAGKAVLKTRTDARLGLIVTDGNGFTLYRFDQDTANPPKSNCYAECAVAWPAETTTGGVTLNGISQSAVGTVGRTDGSTQVTIAGWPVYRFAADAKPGDTNGQGVAGTWFAVTPDGTKASVTTVPAPQTTKPPTTSGGGYGY